MDKGNKVPTVIVILMGKGDYTKNIKGEIVKVFTDEGTSATNTEKRDGFNEQAFIYGDESSREWKFKLNKAFRIVKSKT